MFGNIQDGKGVPYLRTRPPPYLITYHPPTHRVRAFVCTYLRTHVCTRALATYQVGKGATIAASALVNKPVPPGYTAVGVPAKLLPPPKGSQYWKPETASSREMHFERFRQTF